MPRVLCCAICNFCDGFGWHQDTTHNTPVPRLLIGPGALIWPLIGWPGSQWPQPLQLSPCGGPERGPERGPGIMWACDMDWRDMSHESWVTWHVTWRVWHEALTPAQHYNIPIKIPAADTSPGQSQLAPQLRIASRSQNSKKSAGLGKQKEKNVLTLQKIHKILTRLCKKNLKMTRTWQTNNP